MFGLAQKGQKAVTWFFQKDVNLLSLNLLAR